MSFSNLCTGVWSCFLAKLAEAQTPICCTIKAPAHTHLLELTPAVSTTLLLTLLDVQMSAEPAQDEWSDRVQALKVAVSNIEMDGDKEAVTHPRTLKRYVQAVRESPLAKQSEFAVLDVASAAGEPGLTIAHAFPQARVKLTGESGFSVSHQSAAMFDELAEKCW